jgi:DNA polymerase III, epsilon subunit, Proteobacterial
MSEGNNENRILFLDTETTGFSAETGDKIIEIGVVEFINRKPTGRVFHEYVDPEREVPDEAFAVHGWTREDLIAAGKGQKFKDIASRFFEFAKGAELVIHNAPFDMGFLDYELNRIQMPKLSSVCKVFDTLKYANKLYPGKRNNLDALCRRMGVDNSHRTQHGALLDSEILSEVYLLMTQNQNSLEFNNAKNKIAPQIRTKINFQPVSLAGVLSLPVILPDEQDKENHDKIIKRINKESGGGNLWPSM